METSPLILAQSHARNASSAPSAIAASNEHHLAASQFATAAKDTANPEAFRTLKLLEQQHEHLAQLLKFQTSHPVSQTSETIPGPKPTPQAPASPAVTQKPIENSPYRSQPPSPLSSHLPQREISSSIASNLASARGIPSNRQRRSSPASPLLPPHLDNKLPSPSPKSRLGEPVSRAARIPAREKSQELYKKPSPASPAATPVIPPPPSNSKETETSTAPRTDEPFQRFYATFESLFSKLSAPLAFAGLPLNFDDPPPAPTNPNPHPPTRNDSEEHRQLATDPDFSKIFSKAALRALRDEHGGPTAGGPFNGAESFYVVPTTGGTISYADILARAQQEGTRHTNSNTNPDANTTNNDDQLEDEFVDARETPQPASPVVNRRPKPGTKTMEELQLENDALRTLADHVSRRLLEFEMGAQTSSLALQRSIRAMQGPTPSASTYPNDISASGGSTGASSKTKEHGARAVALDEQVAELKRETERMGRENEKLRGVVGRYRERWEKLKEGARVRREGTGDGSG